MLSQILAIPALKGMLCLIALRWIVPMGIGLIWLLLEAILKPFGVKINTPRNKEELRTSNMGCFITLFITCVWIGIMFECVWFVIQLVKLFM